MCLASGVNGPETMRHLIVGSKDQTEPADGLCPDKSLDFKATP